MPFSKLDERVVTWLLHRWMKRNPGLILEARASRGELRINVLEDSTLESVKRANSMAQHRANLDDSFIEERDKQHTVTVMSMLCDDVDCQNLTPHTRGKGCY